MKIVTADEMRLLEQRAVESGVSLDRLMENAGLAVASWIRSRLRYLHGQRILVLVGPGNNGGDGLVAARRLARWGASVDVCLCTRRPDPDVKRGPAEQAGARVFAASDGGGPARLRKLAREAHIVLDAVLGTGAARPIGPPLSELLAAVAEGAEEGDALVVGLDLASGVNSDTGETDPNGLPTDFTLMLGRPKLGPYLLPTGEPLRRYATLDIGLAPGSDDDLPRELLDDRTAARHMPARPVRAHKGTFGRALVVAGSRNYVGAAYLAAAAAGRAGAGLVALAAPESVCLLVASRLSESTYAPLPETEPGELDAGGAARAAAAASRNATCMLVGPGLGQAPATRSFLHSVLFKREDLPPLVLDADCLNYLATLPEWWRDIRRPAVLTPHPGEMSRLTGMSVREIEADRMGTAQQAAERWGHVAILKGACTIVASPDGRARVSPWANPGLASGGAGDVLAGCVAGLLAQGLTPFDAASLGVYAHGLAAELARARLGATGMVAGDVLDALPEAFVRLDATRRPPGRPLL